MRWFEVTGVLLVLLAAWLAGCVGDSSSVPDAGDGGSNDAMNQPDATNGTCVFGTSHFGDGCKFGP
jgi:hypothetical protein